MATVLFGATGQMRPQEADVRLVDLTWLVTMMKPQLFLRAETPASASPDRPVGIKGTTAVHPRCTVGQLKPLVAIGVEANWMEIDDTEPLVGHFEPCRQFVEGAHEFCSSEALASTETHRFGDQ